MDSLITHGPKLLLVFFSKRHANCYVEQNRGYQDVSGQGQIVHGQSLKTTQSGVKTICFDLEYGKWIKSHFFLKTFRNGFFFSEMDSTQCHHIVHGLREHWKLGMAQQIMRLVCKCEDWSSDL